MTAVPEVTTEPEAARAKRAADEIAHLREQLAKAEADASMLRVALEDSQRLLAQRSIRWEADRARLVDAVIDVARGMNSVVLVLREEAPR